MMHGQGWMFGLFFIPCMLYIGVIVHFSIILEEDESFLKNPTNCNKINFYIFLGWVSPFWLAGAILFTLCIVDSWASGIVYMMFI